MTKLLLQNFEELAPQNPVGDVVLVKPEYGRNLEDFEVGQVFVHPRGITVTRALVIDFATTFHEANPLYLNAAYAKSCGFKDVLLSPLLLLNLALSLGVQNDSEKALANLGYYNVMFPAPVYPETSLRAWTKVLDVRSRGVGKPGIVTIRTVAVDDLQNVVVQYDRKIMVNSTGTKTEPSTSVVSTIPELKSSPEINFEVFPQNWPNDLTGTRTRFAAFKPGQIFLHRNGRTVTDEHFAWTYKVMNTHPLHYDRLYSSGLSGKMSGEPIVYGGLLFAWLCGLASRDVSENAVWDLGYTEGYHTQPTVSGDSIAAISRVLKVEPIDDATGAVQMQLIGVKNISSSQAYEKYGADLFIKENDKKDLGKEKLPEKIFEIERRLLIRV